MTSWYWMTAWLPSLLAVVGNGLVISLILTRRRLRTMQNKFVLSLAIADFCVGICYYPGHAICQFVLTSCNEMIRDDIAVLMIYSSVSNLCAMAFDRYIAILRPLQYIALMTTKRAKILTVVAWLIPLTVYFIPSVCASLDLFRLNFKVSVIIWTTIFEFIPCSVLLLATIHAVITSRKHHRRDALLSSQIRYNQPNQKYARSDPSIKVIATVVAIFLICYGVEVYSSFCYFTSLCVMNKNLYNVVRFLVIINSAANPFAYALFKRDVRKELYNIFINKKPVRERYNSERTTSV